MPGLPPHRHVPSSAITAFIDRARIDRLLEPWVPDARQREFVVRCLIDEGPAHHRGANYVLLALLARLVDDGGPTAGERGDAGIPVPLRVPPHLATDEDDGFFPLRLQSAPIERLAARGSAAFTAMVDCLTDGPPQHAMANAAMVALLGVLLDRADAAAR